MIIVLRENIHTVIYELYGRSRITFILEVRFVDVLSAGVTQEEAHTGFLHLPSAVLAYFFLARRIQPFLSVVDREVEFCVQGRLLWERKTHTKMDQIRFFFVLSILWEREWSRFV